jgi:DNA topoisomerase-1
VQTVALRLIVEREREINAFNPVEYWNIDAVLAPSKTGQEFTARMVGVAGQPIRVLNGVDAEGKEQFLSNALPDKGAIDEVMSQLEKATWSVRSIEKRERRQNPKAPFTTSQLQQQAAGRLGFNVRRTMGVAQRDSWLGGQEVWRQVSAGEGERLQEQEGRAGGARGDPSDECGVCAGRGAQVSFG